MRTYFSMAFDVVIFCCGGAKKCAQYKWYLNGDTGTYAAYTNDSAEEKKNESFLAFILN